MCESIEVSCFLVFDKGFPQEQENSNGLYALIDSLYGQQNEIPIVLLCDQPTEHFYKYALERCQAFLNITTGIEPYDLARALKAAYDEEAPFFDEIDFLEKPAETSTTQNLLTELQVFLGRTTYSPSYIRQNDLQHENNPVYAPPTSWLEEGQEEEPSAQQSSISWSGEEAPSWNEEAYPPAESSSLQHSEPDSLSKTIILPEEVEPQADDEPILLEERRVSTIGNKTFGIIGARLRRLLKPKKSAKTVKAEKLEEPEEPQVNSTLREFPSIFSTRPAFPSKVSIGVFSLSRGAGATHTAIAIAEFFARRGPTALMAYDLSHDLELSQIDERVFVYIPTRQEMNDVISVMHSGMVQYIVYDFGTPFELYHNGFLVNSSFSDEEKISFTELQRCDRKVCLTFDAPWHSSKSAFLESYNMDANLTLLSERQRSMDITELMNRLYPGICKRRVRGA